MSVPAAGSSISAECKSVDFQSVAQQSVDARNGQYNNVHDHGHQVNNEVHGSQVNHTTINQYPQDLAGERQKLANWLSPLNFRQRQSEVYGNRREGTGEWVLEDERFKEWQRGKDKVLWCPGIPGAGKTVLASYIINLLAQHKPESVAVVYVYCNYKDQSTQTVHNLVASLLKQLVQDFLPTFERVKTEYESHREKSYSPTLSEIRNTLIKEFAKFSQVLIVVDALDEISEDSRRAELLYNLQSLGGSLLVTSRDIPTIGAALRGNQRMDIRAHDGDICKYIEGRIHLGSHLTQLGRLLENHPDLKQKVLDRLLEKSQGMFLLCRLHLDSLARKITRRGILDALDHLPEGIDDAYDETMRRIYALDEDYQVLALKTIILIIYTSRPLNIRELQAALVLWSNYTDINDGDLVDGAVIMDICTGLVVVDAASKAVRLVHYTAQEYFEGYKRWPFPNPHAEITNICLRVLSLLNGDLYSNDGTIFAFYAGEYWGHHARGPVEETNQATIQEFLSCGERVNNALQFAHFDGFTGSALHLCAFFGLAQTIDYMLKNGSIVDQRDSKGNTPLHIAAVEGHVAVVTLLLNRGYSVNSKNDLSETPLSVAARRGNMEVLKLLLARDEVDVNPKDVFGLITLSYAVQTRNLKAVKLDVDRMDRGARIKLLHAAQSGNMEDVKLLAMRKANVEWEDQYPQTPLSSAARMGGLDVIKLLLAKDKVDVNSKDQYAQTPLSHAARIGSLEIVKLLLARDEVDVNSKDCHGWTPLSYAAGNGHIEILQLLLSREDVILHPLDVNICMPYAFSSRTPYRKELAWLLLLRASVNFRVNWKDRDGYSPLWVAVRQGDEKTVKKLLTYDEVDVNIVPNRSGVPALWASVFRMWYEFNRISAIESSRGEGSSVVGGDNQYYQYDNSQGKKYHALASETKAITRLLLARYDVDINWRNERRETLLHMAARSGCMFVVEQLLSRHDIQVNLQDENGDSPLHYAVRYGYDRVASLLVQQCTIALNLKNATGHTPLCCAVIAVDSDEHVRLKARGISAARREAILKLLLAQDDIDLGLTDNDGSAPLMLTRSIKSLDMLLERYATDSTRLSTGFIGPESDHADLLYRAPPSQPLVHKRERSRRYGGKKQLG